MSTNEARKAPGGLISNSRWNLVAFGLGLVAQFITIPFIVGWIGMDAFGVAAVVLAICAPMSLIGTVLGQALIREVASRASENGHEVCTPAFTTAALRWCLLACAAGWLTLVLVGPFAATPLISLADNARDLWPALLIGASGSVAQQVALLLQSVSAAHQDYRSIAKMTLLTAMMSAALTLGVTWAMPNALGFLLGVAGGFGLAMAAWLCRWWSTISWRGVFSARATAQGKALLQFGKWQGIAQLAGVLGNQIDRYALGAMTPVSVVGQYTVANRLQEAAYIGVIKAGEVLFPRFGAMAHQHPADRLAFFQLASWAVGTLSAALLVPLAILSTSALFLWVGPEAARGADQMLFVLVLGGVIGSASNVFTYCAMGIGRNAAVAGVSVVFSVLTVFMTIALIALMGPAAAGVGLLLASAVRVVLSMVLTRRLFFQDLGWGALFVSTALPVLVGVGVAWVGKDLAAPPVGGWLALVVNYAAWSAVVAAACLLATVSTTTGRDIARRCAHSFTRNRP